jgi:hypothetical protein
VKVETLRPDGARQVFEFANRGAHWESSEQIPEPHGFEIMVTIEHGGYAQTYETQFAEHDHGDGHDMSGSQRTTRFMHRCAATLPFGRGTPTSIGIGPASRTPIGTITSPTRYIL